MKPGDRFTCPACGNAAFAKLEKILDGWEVKGEHLVCSFCGADAGAPDAPRTASSSEVSAGRRALDALFGNTEADNASKQSILDSEEPGERRFCRDCVHALTNVFAVICTRKQCEVQPMDDCPDFERRPPKSASE